MQSKKEQDTHFDTFCSGLEGGRGEKDNDCTINIDNQIKMLKNTRSSFSSFL